ncbi:hypothetical protein M885DRAFT_517316 [Pelagophyceae sp. CCMP2097]|nr:hypothetical protein M885DRAFT_517316 [Pelagophyceae sp. CCMP2097]
MMSTRCLLLLCVPAASLSGARPGPSESRRGLAAPLGGGAPLAGVARYWKPLARLAASGLLAAQLCLAPHAAFAEAPGAAAVELVRSALAAAEDAPSSPRTRQLLTQSIAEWRRSGQPADEVAGLLKLRAEGASAAGDGKAALLDYNAALELFEEANDGSPDLPRAYLARARLEFDAGDFAAAARDTSRALLDDDALLAIERDNPFSYELLADSLDRGGSFAGAADAYGSAEAAHLRVGDVLRATTAAMDKALALYGVEDSDEVLRAPWFRETQRAFGLKSRPDSNNPDDIPVLQDLSKKDAELHLALGARLYARAQTQAGASPRQADARRAEAVVEWSTGCGRLQVYVDDARRRLIADDAADLPDVAAKTPQTGLARSARAFAAIASGLDPLNPYVTQRPGQEFLWYELKGGAGGEDKNGDKGEDYGRDGDEKAKRRRVGSSRSSRSDPRLATVDAALTCDAFGDATWVSANRPSWPWSLAADASKFQQDGAPRAADVPRSAAR